MMAMSNQSSHYPSVARRAWVFVRSGLKVLTHSWGGYTFDDLVAMQDALDGPAFHRMRRRMETDPEGQRLLESRPRLSVHSVDFEALRRLPHDSFGYQFWHHLDRNGLIEDVQLAPSLCPWDEATEYAKARHRETHDIRHVLAGLGVEVWEEAVLQAFQFAQQPQWFSAAVATLGTLKATMLEPRSLVDGRARRVVMLVARAYQAGRRADFLLNVPFEELWELPLDELRRRCGVEVLGDHYRVEPRAANGSGGLRRAG